MADIVSKTVNQTINYLNNLSNEIINYKVDCDLATLKRVNTVKKKTLNVFSKAIDKVKQLPQSAKSQEEFFQSIDVVNDKANVLYEQAINSITEIIDCNVGIQDDLYLINALNKIKKNIKVDGVVNTNKTSKNSQHQQAVNTLKNWFR